MLKFLSNHSDSIIWGIIALIVQVAGTSAFQNPAKFFFLFFALVIIRKIR